MQPKHKQRMAKRTRISGWGEVSVKECESVLKRVGGRCKRVGVKQREGERVLMMLCMPREGRGEREYDEGTDIPRQETTDKGVKRRRKPP